MNTKHTISFKHAFNGIKFAFSTQPNFRIHTIFTILAITLGTILRISFIEWLFIIFAIAFVLACELLNTSIESTVDLITKEKKILAKHAKDTSAGMVLVSAISALIVGLIIFVPYLLPLIL